MDTIEILMSNGSTKREAEEYIENGTMVYDGVDDYIRCLRGDGDLDDMIHEYAINLVDFEIKVLSGVVMDVQPVIYKNHVYIVEYVL